MGALKDATTELARRWEHYFSEVNSLPPLGMYIAELETQLLEIERQLGDAQERMKQQKAHIELLYESAIEQGGRVNAMLEKHVITDDQGTDGSEQSTTESAAKSEGGCLPPEDTSRPADGAA